MKKIIYILFIVGLITSSSCSDFLDREPKTSLSPATFWKTEEDLRLSLNVLYNNMKRSHTLDNQSIDCFASVGNDVSSGTLMPNNTDEIWTKSYKQIRVINDFLENFHNAEVSDAVKNRYLGEALFFNAYFYFDLIKRFGDVPYIKKTLSTDSPELWEERTEKKVILDDILAGLLEAENYVPYKSEIRTDVGRITKGAIQALTARIALYYGTYYKFHTRENYKEYLTIAREASKRLIESKEYKLYSDYRNLFLLPGEDSSEHILSFRYSAEAGTYNPRIRQVILDFIQEPTKHLVDAFLCKDGLPIDKSEYVISYLPLGKEFENRDPRMALTIWKPGDLFLGKPFIPSLFTQTRTGYMFKKYGDENSFNNQRSEIDEILIRYAEVLLIYAEACYELNDRITDDELNISVNTLRKRFAGNPNQLPDLTNNFVASHDLNMREEIRRERRVELASESFRYDDLIRWKTAEIELPQAILGAKFDQQAYPDVKPEDLNLTENGFILVQAKESRSFDVQKDYLFPLPLKDISLNTKLTQNPGW